MNASKRLIAAGVISASMLTGSVVGAAREAQENSGQMPTVP